MVRSSALYTVHNVLHRVRTTVWSNRTRQQVRVHCSTGVLSTPVQYTVLQVPCFFRCTGEPEYSSTSTGVQGYYYELSGVIPGIGSAAFKTPMTVSLLLHTITILIPSSCIHHDAALLYLLLLTLHLCLSSSQRRFASRYDQLEVC